METFYLLRINGIVEISRQIVVDRFVEYLNHKSLRVKSLSPILKLNKFDNFLFGIIICIEHIYYVFNSANHKLYKTIYVPSQQFHYINIVFSLVRSEYLSNEIYLQQYNRRVGCVTQ